MRGGRALDLRQAVRQLGRLGAQKFAACRCLVKQVSDLDARADRAGAGSMSASAHEHRCGRKTRCCRRHARSDRDVGHRGDRCQRFAAKAERFDAFKILKAWNLAGGVPRQRERQLVARNAVPLSDTMMRLIPPASSLTSICVAPASRLFSSNSLTTDAGLEQLHRRRSG